MENDVFLRDWKRGKACAFVAIDCLCMSGTRANVYRHMLSTLPTTSLCWQEDLGLVT